MVINPEFYTYKVILDERIKNLFFKEERMLK